MDLRQLFSFFKSFFFLLIVRWPYGFLFMIALKLSIRVKNKRSQLNRDNKTQKLQKEIFCSGHYQSGSDTVTNEGREIIEVKMNVGIIIRGGRGTSGLWKIRILHCSG